MKRKFTKYPSKVMADIDLDKSFKLGRRKDQIYVVELQNGKLILVTAGPKSVYGLDYTGDRLMCSYGWDYDRPNATDNFLKDCKIIRDARRVTPYANECDALEGATGVPFESIYIDCPNDRWLYEKSGGNILTPEGPNGGARNYNLFKDYSFNDIVDLVISADNSPEHTAENVNHGFGHYKMICTIED